MRPDPEEFWQEHIVKSRCRVTEVDTHPSMLEEEWFLVSPAPALDAVASSLSLGKVTSIDRDTRRAMEWLGHPRVAPIIFRVQVPMRIDIPGKWSVLRQQQEAFSRREVAYNRSSIIRRWLRIGAKVGL